MQMKKTGPKMWTDSKENVRSIYSNSVMFINILSAYQVAGTVLIIHR